MPSSTSGLSRRSQTISVEKALEPPTPTESIDAGNKDDSYYKEKLSPLRYNLRTSCLPFIATELPLLESIQTLLRTPFLDFYFAWTANLASHTFYVLMLPLPLWFGYDKTARDLVYILGLGIYITGNLKDFLCLPRPKSPPLHRITMSGYTTKEYGFPSSHSANATSVTLLLTYQALLNLSGQKLYAILTLLFVYYFSLIFGRIYCGMHGIFDIVTGSVIGIAVVLFRIVLGDMWDDLLLRGGLITPFIIVAFYLGLIHFHSQPADDCPCFDDSVAFIGVLIGLDISHWFLVYTDYLHNPLSPFSVPFEYGKLGLIKTVLRTIVGILLVVIWKAISKPVLFMVLPPIYKIVGIYIPRNFYASAADKNEPTERIIKRSKSISEPVADVKYFVQGLVEHDQTDSVGSENELVNCGALRPRYDVEVIARLIVYAGVASSAVWGFLLVIEHTQVLAV